jgi:hypothetical protein
MEEFYARSVFPASRRMSLRRAARTWRASHVVNGEQVVKDGAVTSASTNTEQHAASTGIELFDRLMRELAD